MSREWKRVTVLALMVVLDAAMSLSIMGETYRPFSWMSISPADVGTLYPVIRNVVLGSRRQAQLSIQVAPGAQCVLQRSLKPGDTNSWQDVQVLTASNSVITMTDTNVFSSGVYYRVKHHIGTGP